MPIPTFEQFKKTFSKASGKPDSRFIEKYGNVSFEEAYPLYSAEIANVIYIQDKIKAFESFLIKQGATCTQSHASESRYYRWNGIKYRFSGHRYPTGSMTDEFTVDLAADPHLINTITF